MAVAPLPPGPQEPGSGQCGSQRSTKASRQGHKCPGELGMSSYGVDYRLQQISTEGREGSQGYLPIHPEGMGLGGLQL